MNHRSSISTLLSASALSLALALSTAACGGASQDGAAQPASPNAAEGAPDTAHDPQLPEAAEAPERTGVVTIGGNPVTLLGQSVEVGQSMPGFTLTGNDMSDLSNDAYAGKVLVLSVVPSLDTGVCAMQTRTFNEKASALSEEVTILTVSMDLPFAQKRFCGAEGIERVVTASDYKYRAFGTDFGVLIKESGLLARAVFVVDRSGTVRHVEYVSEASQEPDYDAAMDAVQAVL
ncbi:thiol peroxidase [Haliangium ochraceum]|uniref:Thiol peroxidase n=1 Tax=Haliangium ochraceum (strain DSM 14365 / JCM 11303 / SMP-2) TaxID=502025 RepID=D0LXJ9_HALO1|nr:thiol peroxidase [Haliangium ochraceum]ACY17754.1 Redoxin domain protein [Haliangium ochraceum DSM 14365]